MTAGIDSIWARFLYTVGTVVWNVNEGSVPRSVPQAPVQTVRTTAVLLLLLFPVRPSWLRPLL